MATSEPGFEHNWGRLGLFGQKEAGKATNNSRKAVGCSSWCIEQHIRRLSAETTR